MGQRILVYSDNPAIGGVQQYNHSLLCKLAVSGYEVTSVQIEYSNHMSEQQQQLGVQQFWLDPDFISGYSRSFADLATPKTLFKQTQPDFVIFSDGWPLGNFAAKQAAIELEIPYMVVVGFVDPSTATVNREDGVPYTQAACYHYTQAKAVVAVSQENLDLLHELFKIPLNHGQVIHYGRPEQYFLPINTDARQRLRSQYNILPDDVVCFTSARLAHVKGYDLQLKTIERLKEHRVWQKLYFLWAGTGTRGECVETEIKQQAQALDIADRVIFLGERSDVPDLLEASDIYILPSRAEGMPLAIMEAMAKGLPVIASAVSGIPEELGETGKLLSDPKLDPERTVAELTSTIQAWAENPGLRHSVGQACQQRASLMFREERMLAQYLTAIERCLQTIQEQAGSPPQVKPYTTGSVRVLECRIRYACTVWEAWDCYQANNLSDMHSRLREALQFTPFSPVETMLNWVETFTMLCQQQRKKLDIYELCQTDEWQELIMNVLETNALA